jgi:dienelactone hydrolase
MGALVSLPSSAAVLESPETFGRRGSLVGILTSPAEGVASRIPVVILGAGIIHKVGPSRVSVQLARRLASEGYPTLRFDLSGIGDSPRVDDAPLERIVLEDIQDAVSLMSTRVGGSEEVCLVGFCSGADNALFAAGQDPRIARVALFDPTVHWTPGFRRRDLARRLSSAKSWWNVLSGRSLWFRIRDRLSKEPMPPPGHYGLLILPPEETDRRVRALVERSVAILYILSRGVHGYCNAPKQVEESLPTGYSPRHISVTWQPDMDHILSDRKQQASLQRLLLNWLAEEPSIRRAGRAAMQ